MRVTLRNACEKDLHEMAELERLCFKAPWSEAMLNEELNNDDAHYFVLENEMDHRIIGHGGYWSILDEAHITNVAISPEFRNHGYGEHLMRNMICAASKEGLQHMTLEVRESNLTAQHLYQKLGFIKAGVRPGYYPDGENAFILWKHGLNDISAPNIN